MLGEWLIGKGKLTEEQLQRGLHDKTFFGERLGHSLVKLGFIDEDTLGEYLAEIARTRYAAARRLESVSAEVLAAVPGRLAAKYCIVPIAIERYYNISLGTKAIPVAPGPPEPRSKVAAPLKAAPRAPMPEVGLDGLPLNADPDDLDQPFMDSGPQAPPADLESSGPLPRSLDAWREESAE